MNKLRAYWRAYRGYCPACNLDAPAIDTCQVCHNYRDIWPPPQRIRAAWLAEYFERLDFSISMDFVSKTQDELIADWPDCGIAGCCNKSCLSLNSPFCHPHTLRKEAEAEVSRLRMGILLTDAELVEIKKILKDACDHEWKDENLRSVAVIAANAIYWRNTEIQKLRDAKAFAETEVERLRAILNQMLSHDGGPGSMDYDAHLFVEARTAAMAAIQVKQ